MIFVGYQGIGKSTLAKENIEVIDLESGNFWIPKTEDDYNSDEPELVRSEDWYKYYINIAKHLSDQGKTVFISSHKIVRDELNKRNITFGVICPSPIIKDEWLERLENRFNQTHLEKDFKAWQNAVKMFDENISDLLSEKHTFQIEVIDYDLYKIISEFTQWIKNSK